MSLITRRACYYSRLRVCYLIGGCGGGGVGGEEGGGDVTGSWHDGAQLYVSLKMENARIIGDLVPHIYGSEPIICS